jgi:hypothetical protein
MMVILLPILVLFLAALSMTALLFWRPKIGIIWFSAVISAFLAWSIVLFLRLQLPDSFTPITGRSTELVPLVITFRLDKISWPYSLALAASLLAYVLIAVVGLTSKSFNRSEWISLPASLVLGGLGLSAVFSGNLNTLLLSWAAIDLLWLFFMLGTSRDYLVIMLTFAVRAAGIYLAIAMAFTQPAGTPLIFPGLDPAGNTILFLAAFLRLGSMLLNDRFVDQRNTKQTFHVISTVVLAASAMIVVTRESGEIMPSLAPVFVGLTTSLAVIFGLLGLIRYQRSGATWLWISGIASLGVISAIIAQTDASLAWGIALILSGSLLCLLNLSSRAIKFLFVIGFICLSTLPFTPNWQGIRIYPLPGEGFKTGYSWLFWLLAQAFLFASFTMIMLKPRPAQPATERWAHVLPLIGLIFLPVTQITILLIGVPGITNDLQAFPPLSLIVFSLIPIAFTAIGARFFPKTTRVSVRASAFLDRISPYQWISRTIDRVFNGIAHFIGFIDQLIEGEGGILWTMLFVLLLFALWIRFRAGG